MVAEIKYLKIVYREFKYIGVDYNPENNNNDFINHNLENGMPSNLESIDIINAADVLEHIDNIHDIFNSCLNVANKKIAIALPTMAYYKFKLNFY